MVRVRVSNCVAQPQHTRIISVFDLSSSVFGHNSVLKVAMLLLSRAENIWNGCVARVNMICDKSATMSLPRTCRQSEYDLP
jgi:hypothetical protein